MGEIDVPGAVRERIPGKALGFHCLGLVEVVGAHRGIGEHGNAVGLHLHHSARDVDHLFRAAVRGQDPDRARLDAREQRDVLGQDAELAARARRDDHGGLARVDRLLGADDLDVDCLGH